MPTEYYPGLRPLRSSGSALDDVRPLANSPESTPVLHFCRHLLVRSARKLVSSLLVKLICGLFSIGTLCMGQQAADAAPLCPTDLDQVEQIAKNPPEGWSVDHAPGKHRLDSFMVFSGPPEKMANEIYHHEKIFRKDGKSFHDYSWELGQIDDPWVQCGYSYTALTLIKSVKEFKYCDAVFLEDIDEDMRLKTTECR